MKRPVARPIDPSEVTEAPRRMPRAFAAEAAIPTEAAFEAQAEDTEAFESPQPRKMGWLGRLAWSTAGALVSLGVGLAIDRLIRDLFDRQEWLGWLALAIAALLVLAILVLAIREYLGVRRLQALGDLRDQAQAAVETDRPADAKKILGRLETIYAARPDMARARKVLADDSGNMLDGAEQIHLAERQLMAPLDARARALTAQSARRVALVTAVSPRALIDVGFVIYESVKLGGAIARLYGARPGFIGSWRLAGAILAHLAVTGGLVLTDGLVEQLVGQGLAQKLSARLGEGVVNGLMTVRVGIAAMRVVRPLPFVTQDQPLVRDFIGDLANVSRTMQEEKR
ncbi:UPF0283 membrane protein [Devosia pacifica]|uniref:UPF0283 membrane protein n=1 Tax=Devosia pacifica TaxID=1335967 RepID=A0A918RZJ1_9HYPH|nr:TIGR01620 family protein [Devosia pacifica]GHA14846.1 UPF0283 membrane protein [Devosia pacifica]